MTSVARRTFLVLVLGGGSLVTMAWAQPPAGPPGATPGPNGADAAPFAQLPGDRPDLAPPITPRPPGLPGEEPGHDDFSRRPNDHALPGRHPEFVPGRRAQVRGLEFEALRQAVGKLKAAKNDEEKTIATRGISQVLEKSFNRDLEQRETQVSEVEARVKRLREQIEKRKKAKDQIISLRLQTLVNEADGLGFPGQFDQQSEFILAPDDLPRHGFRFGFPQDELTPVEPVPVRAMTPNAAPAQNSTLGPQSKVGPVDVVPEKTKPDSVPST
jgi:hypothetical protein